MLFNRLSAVCAVVFFAFVASTMTCAVAEGVSLTAEERSEVIASLRAYQANFSHQRVRIEIAGREIWEPPQGRLQPFNIELELSGSQIYANYSIGKVSGFAGKGKAAAATSKDLFVKFVFDGDSDDGIKVYFETGGKIVQAEKPLPPMRLQHWAGSRLLDAIGYQHHRPALNTKWSVIETLEKATSFERRVLDNNETEIVAVALISEIDSHELRLSDLPDVRLLSSVSLNPGRSEVRGTIQYKKHSSGLMLPYLLREARAFVTGPERKGPLVLRLAEEAVITEFSLIPFDEAGPFPVITVPEGMRIRDRRADAKSNARGAVAAPQPEPK
jgi:hypothetical protein